MAYARMRVFCKDALICDFAQYYHIYDLYSMDVQTAAILACGLPPESRTMRQISDQKYDVDTLLRMRILDTLRYIEYAYLSTHSKRKPQKPESIFRLMTNQKDDKDIKAFQSTQEFEAERERILKDINHGR